MKKYFLFLLLFFLILPRFSLATWPDKWADNNYFWVDASGDIYSNKDISSLHVTGDATFDGTSYFANMDVSEDLTVDGTIIGDISGDITGNAGTATALETAREIAGQSFDGTANITIASTNLTDTSDLLYETELDEFDELQSQISDKTLVNEEDDATFDGDLRQVSGKSFATDEIKAVDGDGLKLNNDGGNGIFIDDNGNIGLNDTDPNSSVHHSSTIPVFTIENTTEENTASGRRSVINMVGNRADGTDDVLGQIATSHNGAGADGRGIMVISTADTTGDLQDAITITDDQEVFLASGQNQINPPDIIGVEWNQGTDTWRHINLNGETINLETSDFDQHPVWGGMRRCNMDATGDILCYQNDPDFKLDGSNGKVMVEIPRSYVSSANPSANVYRWWLSSKPFPGSRIHYAFRQGGDGISHYSDYLYVGAYEAGFEHDSTNNHYELQSQTGVQPWTGGEITKVSFDAGQNEPAVEDLLSTATDSSYYVVDWVVRGGAWATNDATGDLWLRKPGDDACGFANNEDVTNDTQSNVFATIDGAVSELTLTINDARTYAQNIGTGWNITNFWELSLVRLLYYIEYADADSQTTIGQGIVNKASGTGFAGELTGADSIDTNVSTNGTGSGTGTDGLTPISYRNIENLWGSVWNFTDGYNAIDASYDLARMDGTSTFASPLVLHSSSTTAPITTDGYQTNLLYETNLEFAFLPSSAAGGSSSTYLCDFLFAHDIGETNILLFGGRWSDSAHAGAGCLASDDGASTSNRYCGCRLSYLKP